MNIELQILFDLSMDSHSILPTPEEIALRTRDPISKEENVYKIRFKKAQGYWVPENPCLIGWVLEAPVKKSAAAFKELSHHLTDIVAIEECRINMEGFSESDPRPLQINSFSFNQCTAEDVGDACYHSKGNKRVIRFGKSDTFFLSDQILRSFIYPDMEEITHFVVSMSIDIDIDVSDAQGNPNDKMNLARKTALKQIEEMFEAHEFTYQNLSIKEAGYD